MRNNPWQVDSIEAFSYLKCPECTFNTKDEISFQDHALENHILSCAFYGKIKSHHLSTSLVSSLQHNNSKALELSIVSNENGQGVNSASKRKIAKNKFVKSTKTTNLL